MALGEPLVAALVVAGSARHHLLGITGFDVAQKSRSSGRAEHGHDATVAQDPNRTIVVDDIVESKRRVSHRSSIPRATSAGGAR